MENAPPLWHFSERPGIARFEPHVPATNPGVGPYVWAIDDWHAPMYWLPRDCPRACFWATADSPDAAIDTLGVPRAARMVIAIHPDWLDAVRTTTIYRYAMPTATFRLRDPIAGHWVSDETVEPLGMEPVGDLLNALAGADIELRITPALAALGRAAIDSGLAFSLTRMRNLPGWQG
jgi:hypothetical protein